jgi:flagellar hook-associated protein 2
MATTSGITSLDSTYTNLLNYQIQVESAPLTRLQSQQSALKLQRAVYADLKTKLESLRTSAKSLISTDAFYSLKPGKSVSVSNIATGTTVISAAASTSAVAASYDIADISLALADRVRSDEQEYSDQALGKSGTIYVGGGAERSIVNHLQALDTISNISINDQIAVGQQELGTGTYYVETQQTSDGIWQFRVVDSEGATQKIASGSSSTSFTSSWQAIPTGESTTYSTGRGLNIDFGTDPSKYVAKSKLGGATSVEYQPKGAEISITADMSLNGIASAINSGTFASGNEVTATVVNKQLVLSAKQTGLLHKIEASGEVLEQLGVLTGSAFKNVMQSARNATFTVNGLEVIRSQNSLLTDVISGVTLNLASDAEGKSATLNVVSDNTSSKNAINAFITNFNNVQTYIKSKLAVTKNADDTYTRGSLSGDQSIVSLRNSLFNIVGSSDATATVYKSLKDIGITVNSSLTMAITDSAKFENALKTNYSDVLNVVDRVMTSVNSKLDKYTGTTSYVDQLIKANDLKTKYVATSITSMNKRLDARKESLTNYYVDIQAQMDLLSNTQNTNSAWLTSLYSSMYK